MEASIYLDHAAATPLDPRVDEAMRRRAGESFANPSSPHRAGRRARAVLEEARESILAAVGGVTSGPRRDRLVFTSGATEANRLGMLGTAGHRRGVVGLSARDHGSVHEAARSLEALGWRVARLGLDAGGTAAAAAADLLATEAGPALICTTLVCGQTGIRESPTALAGSDLGGRILVHADAAQAVAWDAISFRDLPVTSLALAPCKFGGPRGIGAVVVRGGVDVAAVVPGPQELSLRGGTEPVVLAAGFAAAVEIARAEREAAARRVEALRDRFEEGLVAVAGRHGFESLVVGRGLDRSPHIATVAIRGCDRQALVMACDLAGVCLATGTACASGSSDPAAAIVALDVPDWVARGAVRASIGTATTPHDIDEAVQRIDGVFPGLVAAALHHRGSVG